MPLSGDFAGLGKLAANLERLAQVPSQIATDVSESITKKLQEEFKDGNDPYGKAWAPLKPSTLKRGRKPPPLDDSGKLKGGTKAFPLPGAGIGIVLGAPYGVFHQSGTRTMAARKVLPDKTLPKEWSALIKSSALKNVSKILKK